MDVVYILGSGSKWQDNEIRYSVRSVEKHLKDRGRIFIVGHKPKFFNELITEIPYKDIFHNPARNIMSKINRASRDERISNNFFLFNDDYFLLKDISKKYPYYYKSTLEESIKINSHNVDYLSHLTATDKLLKDRELPRKNFDVHYPIIYNKKNFLKVCKDIEWNVPAGYTMRSVYCNTLQIEGELIKDCKVNHPHFYWDHLTEDNHCLSIGDRSINKSFINFLNRRFPTPSRYEA